ncbi:MAG: polysaccharide deacetylase family protein [Treponema sp.]|jgi:peptidoglycan/xylan/chitin deacetylase (PgdA/CDA1 family)|nr:polysaccharide deacetylase family protein [Treponema sp.]
MRNNFAPAFLPLLMLVVLLGGCMSINRTRRGMSIPPGHVIFSFDDGPNVHEDTTARLLDVLKKYEIRAMFALLGENAEHSPELVRRIRDEGHYIINHGYCDKWAVSMENGEFRENLRRGAAAISAALGEEPSPRLYRPQGGYFRKQHRRIWREEGYVMVAGTIRVFDAVIDSAEKNKVRRRIVRAIAEHRGGMILLHDARDSHFRMERALEEYPGGEFNRSWIPEVTEEIIVRLLEKGYRLNGFDILELLNIES